MDTREKYRNYLVLSLTKGVEPVNVVRAEGAHIFDDRGTDYIDLFAGIAVVNAGHGHPKVREAAHRQIDRLIHCNSYSYYTGPAADLAERLAEITPGELRKSFFSNSGAEAVEAALRMARVFTSRREFIALERGFHGRSYGTLSLTGNLARKTRGGPYAPGVAFAPAPYPYRSLFGDDPEVVAEKAAQAVEDVIRFQTSGDVAAFIVEPVMGEGGIIVPPESYLRRVKAILDRHGILLIVDEVQTGFGRTGRLFATERLGVEPDIMTMAKGLGDGFPIGATTARAEIADAFHPGEHFSTFGGNPVACAAALASIEVILSEGLSEKADAQGKRVMKAIGEAKAALPAIGEVRGLGLMIGVELVKDPRTKEPDPDLAALVRSRCRERGVLIGVGGPDGNVIRLQPPLVISDGDLDRAVDILLDGLSQGRDARPPGAA